MGHRGEGPLGGTIRGAAGPRRRRPLVARPLLAGPGAVCHAGGAIGRAPFMSSAGTGARAGCGTEPARISGSTPPRPCAARPLRVDAWARLPAPVMVLDKAGDLSHLKFPPAPGESSPLVMCKPSKAWQELVQDAAQEHVLSCVVEHCRGTAVRRAHPFFAAERRGAERDPRRLRFHGRERITADAPLRWRTGEPGDLIVATEAAPKLGAIRCTRASCRVHHVATAANAH
jgi:hypothetical protein